MPVVRGQARAEDEGALRKVLGRPPAVDFRVSPMSLRGEVGSQRQLPQLQLGLDLAVGEDVLPAGGVAGEQPDRRPETRQRRAEIVVRPSRLAGDLGSGLFRARSNQREAWSSFPMTLWVQPVWRMTRKSCGILFMRRRVVLESVLAGSRLW